MGYGTTLLMILIITNAILYIYGIDMPLTSWLSIGAQEIGSGTPTQPLGATQGGIASPNLIWQIILVIVAAVIAGVVAGILPGALGSSYTVMFTIPLAMFLCFGLFIISPMGSIVGAWQNTESMYCYNTRAGVKMFNLPTDAMGHLSMCVPGEVHLLILIFFGLLTIAAMMSFVAGRDW